MDTEGQELRPYEPVPDVLILAAIERAVRHGTAPVWIVTVGDHLGFRRARHTTRRLRRDLERLAAPRSRCVDQVERHGREYWTLTLTGEGWLAAQRERGAVDELPESPQHRSWREARAAAAARMDHFRGLLTAAMEDAGTAQADFIAPPSDSWMRLSRRLAAAFWLVGSAMYCRDEWPEPSDDCIDTDPDPAPPPGRRALTAWYSPTCGSTRKSCR